MKMEMKMKMTVFCSFTAYVKGTTFLTLTNLLHLALSLLGATISQIDFRVLKRFYRVKYILMLTIKQNEY